MNKISCEYNRDFSSIECHIQKSLFVVKEMGTGLQETLKTKLGIKRTEPTLNHSYIEFFMPRRVCEHGFIVIVVSTHRRDISFIWQTSIKFSMTL